MTGTGRRTYRRRYSALEIAALAISVSSGAAFLLLVWFLGFLDRVIGLRAGEMDAPGLGLVAILVVLACLLSTIVALILAAAALLRLGRGWRLPAVAWMIGASLLTYAGAQDVLRVPTGGELAGLEGPRVHQGMEKRQQEAGVVERALGPQPASPPEAILTSAHRDAAGFEGTFCWVPKWASNCVRDAGIPLLPEQETITVRQGDDADLVFVLRASEREFVEGEPMLVGAVAYPLAQEAKTVPTPAGVRYLVPDGGKRVLEKKRLHLEREVELEDPPWSVVVGEVPEGEYMFQISARQHEDVDPSWGVANYHFRVRVLPEAGR